MEKENRLKKSNGLQNHRTNDLNTPNEPIGKPKIACCESYEEQLEVINDQLVTLLKKGIINNTIILHRTSKGIKLIEEFLIKNNFKTEELKPNLDESDSDSIKTAKMSWVRDHSFKNVFIVDLNDDIIPAPQRFIEENDDYSITVERNLLYHCIESAEKNLFLLTSDRTNASRYLKEIDANLLEDITPNNWFPQPYFGECSFPF